MIEAGACAIQIENQVSDEKQCGHQDGKVTVPHADFLAKIRAVRYAFIELGVENGIIVARTDSLGAGLTKQIAVTNEPGDLGDQYNSFLDGDVVQTADDLANGDVVVKANGQLLRPKRLASGCSDSSLIAGEDRLFSTALPRYRMAPTFCGLRPRSRMWVRLQAWLIVFGGRSKREAGLQQQPVV